MINFLMNKLKIGSALLLALLVSMLLTRYVFPTRTTVINTYFLSDVKSDWNRLLANVFDSKIKEQNEQIGNLMKYAQTGTYKTIGKGVEMVENANGAVFRTSVNAMDWEEYKTYTINGKTLKIRVEKGKEGPSQALLEKLAKYY